MIFFSCKEFLNTEKDGVNILSMGDMPNEQTEYDTIYTKNTDDNINLINHLKLKLETDGFSFEELKIAKAYHMIIAKKTEEN